MQLLMNLFFLVHQLDTTLGLRVIDNGLGFPVYGGEDAMVDYALLADDQKSPLPSKVQHRHYHICIEQGLHVKQALCF